MQQAVAVNTPEELEQSLRGDTKSVYSVHVGLLETILHGDQFGFLEESTKDLAQVGLKITKVWRMHHKVFPSPNAMDNPTLVFVVETFDNIYKWLSTGRCYDAISRTCRGLPRIDLCSSIATLDANRSPDDIWLCACVFPFKRAAKVNNKKQQ